jgi:hypothetical protein
MDRAKVQKQRNTTSYFFQRFSAAFFAISLRRADESVAVLAAAPACPLRVRPEVGARSSISPVAILPTMMAAPIASAGRFSPFGPLGIGLG